jgi:hypothetical protein
MINQDEFLKMFEGAKDSLAKIMKSHDEIMGKLKEHDAEKFEEIAKDSQKIREAKSIKEINNIMQKYADFDNK